MVRRRGQSKSRQRGSDEPALRAALGLLARRDYFRGELSERLLRKGFDPQQVEVALSRCSELGYLDDEKLSARFVELRAGERGWGGKRLAAELRSRGVSPEVAEAAAVLSPELLDEALKTALRRSERRLPEGWWCLHEQRGRMVSSLIRRGFDADDAHAAVARLAAERE
jgi:regulatory protein